MPEQHRFSAESSATFTPFWRRLPSFFLYPMQIGSMMRIAGYSVIGGISLFVPDAIGGLLRLILWIVFLKYAFLVILLPAVDTLKSSAKVHSYWS